MLSRTTLFFMTIGSDSPSKAKNAPPANATPPVLVADALLPEITTLAIVAPSVDLQRAPRLGEVAATRGRAVAGDDGVLQDEASDRTRRSR